MVIAARVTSQSLYLQENTSGPIPAKNISIFITKREDTCSSILRETDCLAYSDFSWEDNVKMDLPRREMDGWGYGRDLCGSG
jgi:hypothetical protein